MIFENYVLPEFAFLDANNHLGNPLKNRDILIHTPTNTLLEIIALDNVLAHDFTAPKHEFTYINLNGDIELHCFVIHFTTVFDYDHPEIFKKCEEFYTKYLDWQDRNIMNESKSVSN